MFSRTVLILALLASGLDAQDQKWGDFIEAEFPFFCHTLDPREHAPKTRVIPRGIILKLGENRFACFDPDLLRIALIWQASEGQSPISLQGMAPGSYHEAGKKSPGGQSKLPRPQGEIVYQTGVRPGWHVGALPKKLGDPRAPSLDPEEVGLGPIDPSLMRWSGIHAVSAESAVLEYEVGGANIQERIRSLGTGIWREIHVGGSEQDLFVEMGNRECEWKVNARTETEFAEIVEQEGVRFVRIPKSVDPVSLVIIYDSEGEGDLGSHSPRKSLPNITKKPQSPSAFGWAESVTTAITASTSEGPYVVDQIGTPTTNPWARNVRLSGFDFFSDGRAAFSTFDGDVWLTSALHNEGRVLWKRFASGLNEPMALQIVENEIYVFGRTCVWRLRDKNEDGEADYYENFCNLVGQTGETREFPNDMVKIPGGGFYLAKPGQILSTRGLHNGTITKVAADGRSFEVVARGFRQPFIGYDSEKNQLTASDQQGNWVPATPIHLVKKDGHYGYLPPMEKEHPQPVLEPLVWIPHFVNQSAASQITNRDQRFGPLAGGLLHIGFNRPELFRIYQDGGQGAAAKVLGGFGTGTLKGAVNPIDGQLYLCGFRIWGTIANDVTGFYRVKYTGGGVFQAPTEVRSSASGVLLRFDFEVEEEIATNLANYEVDRWNYRRTSGYGSGHYRLDGQSGQETLQASSVYLSHDQRAVFLGIPGMKPSHSLRVTYRLPTSTLLPEIRSVYLTVHELKELNFTETGFGDLKVDLTPPVLPSGEARVASVTEGERLYTAVGCAACHTIDGTESEKPGPTWLGLYNSPRNFADGGMIKKADEVYLRESILNPGLNVTKGFASEDVKMPAYLGILQDYQVDSLILFIRSLSN